MSEELFQRYKKVQKSSLPCSECKKGGKDVTLMQCSRCKFSRYCSAECQRAHYPQHKNLCLRIKEMGYDAWCREGFQNQLRGIKVRMGLGMGVPGESAEEQMEFFVSKMEEVYQ